MSFDKARFWLKALPENLSRIFAAADCENSLHCFRLTKVSVVGPTAYIINPVSEAKAVPAAGNQTHSPRHRRYSRRRHLSPGELNPTWTPKVCRIMAFCRYWAIILPTLGGLGKPEPLTLNPEPLTLNPKPSTLNP